MPRPDKEDFFPYPKDDPNFFDPGIPKGVISPSGFNMYRRCPRQFEFAYVMEMRRPPGIAMTRGTAIHKGAEVVHKHTIEHKVLMPEEQGIQAVSDCWDEKKAEIEDWKDNKGNVIPEGAVKDSAIAGFRIYYATAIQNIVPVAAEKPFAQKIGTVPVRGVIDLVDSVEDDYTLEDDPEGPPPRINIPVDIKTTAKMWAQQKIDFEPQFTFYSIVEKARKIRVDFITEGRKGCSYKGAVSERTNLEKRILIEDLEEAVDFIKKGVFPRCDPTSWACTPKFCGYYAQCRGAA